MVSFWFRVNPLAGIGNHDSVVSRMINRVPFKPDGPDRTVVGWSHEAEAACRELELSGEIVGNCVIGKLLKLEGEIIGTYKDVAPIRVVFGDCPDGRRIRVEYIGGATVKMSDGKDVLAFQILAVEAWPGTA